MHTHTHTHTHTTRMCMHMHMHTHTRTRTHTHTHTHTHTQVQHCNNNTRPLNSNNKPVNNKLSLSVTHYRGFPCRCIMILYSEECCNRTLSGWVAVRLGRTPSFPIPQGSWYYSSNSSSLMGNRSKWGAVGKWGSPGKI